MVADDYSMVIMVCNTLTKAKTSIWSKSSMKKVVLCVGANICYKMGLKLYKLMVSGNRIHLTNTIGEIILPLTCIITSIYLNCMHTFTSISFDILF